MPNKTNSEGRPVTIYDIAKEAGVSASTVSRALNDSSRVSRETKRRIIELAEKYNFRPNALAQGLAEARSRLIGIVVADIRNPYYAELFFYCEKVAQEAGYIVVVFNQPKGGGMAEQIRMLEKMLTLQMEAVILIDGMVARLVSDVEYVDEVKHIMEHLISLGHRDIALLGGYMDILSTYEKAVHYRQVLRRHKILYRPELVSEQGDYDRDGGYRLMNRMLDAGISMTAVIAVNDIVATGVVKCLDERGYRIPEDISVVGCDNTYAGMMAPRLTTVGYDYEEMGRCLIETALAAIRGEKGQMLKMIEPVLVQGESTGRVPESH
nr:LacI family DNA-binding transcriptional regulator [uncultured Acetatifactor sp.]